ncbi:TPA: shikimate kinase [Thermoplasmata archaeon]|nr:shikimate kinase [Thermoplasmata archaeon]
MGDGAGLVAGCVRATAARAGTGQVHGRVEVRSDIPASRGLKSSSAVSNVVVLATARALGRNLEDSELLDIAIDESIRAKVTVTGAFDDAAACYYGGLVVTDNTCRTVLRTGSLDPALSVVLHIPDRTIPKDQVDKARFGELKREFDTALELTVKGDYPRAIEVNSMATARALDLSDEASEAAREAGAYAAGITGTGPASFALCAGDVVEAVEKIFSQFGGRTVRASLNTVPSKEVIPRLLS